LSPTDGADEDPVAETGQRLAIAFERIHRERMAGLPILHPDLAVAVVGGCAWYGHWLGVLVTPWCMNLVLVPAFGSELAHDAQGTKRLLDFPAGQFEFVSSPLDDLGTIATCSLFSPMQAFADQAAAEATAAEVMTALFEPNPDTTAPGQRDAQAGATGAKSARFRPDPGVSRRDLLRGSFRSG
jgi:[NiFe] hydrogenase assembly HybE family chaperone